MRLWFLLFTAMLAAAPVQAQGTAASSSQEQTADLRPKDPPTGDHGTKDQATTDQDSLPVSLDKIKEGLGQTPTLSLRTLDERPTFRIQILERQKLDELLATLNYKAGPTPAGGLYWSEIQRQMFPAVDNPLRQPYSAFNQGELLTILVENLVGKYLGGKAVNAVSNAERARAENAAKEDVKQAIRDYCSAQPNGGAGIQICTSASAFR